MSMQLTADQLEAYYRDGYVVVEDLLRRFVPSEARTNQFSESLYLRPDALASFARCCRSRRLFALSADGSARDLQQSDLYAASGGHNRGGAAAGRHRRRPARHYGT